MNLQALETTTREIGLEIFRKARMEEPSVWEPLWWERGIIQWLVGDPEIKSRVLRFIDVFPSLKSGKAVARHIREYLPYATARLPRNLRLGRAVVESALFTPGAAASASRLAVKKMARRFIAGASVEEAAEALDVLLENGMTYTLDLLGEATLSEREADAYAEKYIKLISYLAAGRAPGDPPVNVSLKLSSLTPRFDPAAPEDASSEALRRLRHILKTAAETKSLVNIDMEQSELRDLTLSVFYRILDDGEFREWDGLGIVAQAYLKDAEDSLNGLLRKVRESGRKVIIRLVKGAYWDREIVVANQRRWPVPVHTNKADTDAAFERMTTTLLENSDIVTTAVASHNARSIARAVAAARALGVSGGDFEIQMLYGMGDPIKKALVDMDVPVRVYAPFGEMIPGMAYLVRRILENSSNESFLRRSFVEDMPEEELLKNPAENTTTEAGAEPQREEPCKVFVNEPPPKFHEKATRNAMDKAIEVVRNRLGATRECLIDGERISTNEVLTSTDPSSPDRIVGEVFAADEGLAVKAMDAAAKAFKDWARTPAKKRHETLSLAAAIIRERKYELAAWQMFEVGKTRREALGDIDEAIDHILFYSTAAQELPKIITTEKILGETNHMYYIPRGPGVVISPWNFPLAILAGLASSALAVGDTVVIKPSSNAVVTGALFVDILVEAGVPRGVVNFLPGAGGALGPALIGHSATSFVSFTGSWDVGAAIAERAAKKSPERQGFIKVIAEMGGKNALIIDESADLDEAVAGVISSAFGYGGQKCSACSRAIVLKEVYNDFVERLVNAAEGLVIGSPLNPETFHGPLIDDAAKRKADTYIEMGEKEFTPLLIRDNKMEEGHYAYPTIFGDVDPSSRLAREEIFGPVLSIIRANGIDQAIEIANSASYALTGGIFSRTPSNVAKAVETMEAGNFYVNRKITGSIVRRQPFGGYKMSGMGSAKAGSVELLKELSVPRVVTENIVRRGFSPDLES